MSDAITVAQMTSVALGTVYDIELCPGYGFIAPMVWTTNGGLYAATLIAEAAKSGRYTFSSDVIAVEDWSNRDEVRAALLKFWLGIEPLIANRYGEAPSINVEREGE